ncbi:MAG: sensor domain-containing diguanylate cyclase [Rhodospirillales bacterium]|nr:sensor domain-containing diguanylate cyclase [Rhodospirillales bacterium]
MHDERRLSTLRAYDPAGMGQDHGLDTLCSLVRMTLNVPMAAVTLVDERLTHHVGMAGMELGALPNEITFCSRTIEGTLPMLVEDATKDVRFANNPFVITDPGVRFYLGAPLIAPDGSALGAICAVDTKTRVCSDDEITKLCTLASTAVQILEMRRRMNEVRAFALTDSLTGIANRVGVELEIEKAIAVQQRHALPFALAYFDVDHFKQVNDQLGHGAGDRLLRLIGQALAPRTRREEASGRLGGDEFVILLIGANTATAHATAVQIKARLDQTMAENGFPVSFSMGVAVFEAPPPSVEAALSQADSLLYKVKRQGKNQIIIEAAD